MASSPEVNNKGCFFFWVLHLLHLLLYNYKLHNYAAQGMELNSASLFLFFLLNIVYKNRIGITECKGYLSTFKHLQYNIKTCKKHTSATQKPI